MIIKTCRHFFAVLFFSCCICSGIIAQQTAGPGNSYFHNAVDLYEKGQYVDAEAQFRKAAEAYSANDNVMRSTIAAYRALCAINMIMPNTESIVEELESYFGSDPRINEIYFGMGRKFYYLEEYQKAVDWFERVDDRELSLDNRLESRFLQGHSYFQLNDYSNAWRLFTGVMDLPNNKYTIPATYYYAHIEYKRYNYTTALEAFKSIRNDDRFTIPASYYMLQIYAHE